MFLVSVNCLNIMLRLALLLYEEFSIDQSFPGISQIAYFP